MVILVLGLLLFFAAHVFVTFRNLRTAAIGRLGEKGYRILFSLVSLGGLILIVLGWRSSPFIPVWELPVGLRHLAIALVWIAFVLFTVAEMPPGRIKPKVRHPMLAGIKFWAFAHLMANGDLVSMILFGSFLAYAVFDRMALKRRALNEAEGSAAGPGRNDVIAVAIGTVLFLIFAYYLHPLLIGVPVMPAPAGS